MFIKQNKYAVEKCIMRRKQSNIFHSMIQKILNVINEHAHIYLRISIHKNINSLGPRMKFHKYAEPQWYHQLPIVIVTLIIILRMVINKKKKRLSFRL